MAGSVWKNIFVDYSISAPHADVSNVGSNSIERIGIDRGDDDPGTQIDETAKINSVSAKKDGDAVKIQTNQALTLRDDDQLVVVLDPVQNPQNAGTAQANVVVNHGLDPSINDTTSLTYEYNDANVTFADQTTFGSKVVIDRVSLSEGGYVAISNKSGENPSAIRGTSRYLSPGVHENVEVTLDVPVDRDTTLWAIVHTDANANRKFDYQDEGGEWDNPYLNKNGNLMAQTDAAIDHQQKDPANFAVSVDSTNSPVQEGDTLSVTATVQNTGDETGTQTVTLSDDGTQVDSQSVSLAGGESSQVTLSWSTADGDAGSHTMTVASDDDSASDSVTVQQSESTTTTTTSTPTTTTTSTPTTTTTSTPTTTTTSTPPGEDDDENTVTPPDDEDDETAPPFGWDFDLPSLIPPTDPVAMYDVEADGMEVTYDAGATVTDDEIAAYYWETDGDRKPEREGAEVTIEYDDPGFYRVTLTVVDEEGNEDTRTKWIFVANDEWIESVFGESGVPASTDTAVAAEAGSGTSMAAVVASGSVLGLSASDIGGAIPFAAVTLGAMLVFLRASRPE